MKRTVEFHHDVVAAYDAEIGKRFLREIGSASSISYAEGMSALNRALLGGAAPLAPGFGRTDSVPVALEVPAELKEAFESLERGEAEQA